jgi:hypothetical protein
LEAVVESGAGTGLLEGHCIVALSTPVSLSISLSTVPFTVHPPGIQCRRVER